MEQKIIAYIDGANLHRGSHELGFDIDYQKFYHWLSQKYSLGKIYLFLGYIPKYRDMYQLYESYGYKLIFKETITNKNGTIKGNCDAELILKTVSDYYEQHTDSYILISGDGDFGCLVEFLKNKHVSCKILSPARHRLSYLLRKTQAPLTFLDDHYHKFSKSLVNEKTPDADVSA